MILVAPIPTRDYSPRQSVVIPLRVCDHLGLDDRSKIVTTEMNRFIWVGPDVVPNREGSPYFGTPPAALHQLVRKHLLNNRARIIGRSI